MNRIRINVSKPYDVVIDRGLIRTILPLIEPVCSGKNIAVITDDIVDGLYGQAIINQLKGKDFDVCKFVFPNGEQSKNIDTLSDILEFLANNEFKRNDTIVALGGGVVGDIGGKTAIDLKAGKNLAGSFWQPSLVVCDIDIIEKLPQDIFAEGMGEVIKYDVIGNYGICDKVQKELIKENLESVITSCIESKKQVIEEDEFETNGVRKLLNVGHTVAHGIEKMSDYEVPHGFAVGTGLVLEAAIAYLKRICNLETFETIKNTVIKAGLMIDASYDLNDFVNCMKKDKKNNDNRISFLLPNKMGKCKEYKLTETELVELLKQVGKLI